MLTTVLEKLTLIGEMFDLSLFPLFPSFDSSSNISSSIFLSASRRSLTLVLSMP